MRNPTPSLPWGECPPTNERQLCKLRDPDADPTVVKQGRNGSITLFDGSGEHHNYKSNQRCSWDLTSSTALNMPLMINFHRFELEHFIEAGSDGCLDDYVKIWQSSCSQKSDATLLTTACGCGPKDKLTARPSGPRCSDNVRERFPKVVTKGSEMCVEFASDRAVQLNGFEAVVSVVSNREATREEVRGIHAL